MTKEIIIDGVNIAGCGYYDAKNDKGNWCDLTCTQEHSPFFRCESMPYCNYKQLKRLEQENKELKVANQSLSILGTDLVSAHETVRKEFFRADKNKDMWREKAEEYRSSLEEIREIVTSAFAKQRPYKEDFAEIETKINEVLQ
jgi:hypothetical protein